MRRPHSWLFVSLGVGALLLAGLAAVGLLVLVRQQAPEPRSLWILLVASALLLLLGVGGVLGLRRWRRRGG